MTALIDRDADEHDAAPAPRPTRSRPGIVLAALAVAATVLVVVDSQLPVVRAVAGLLLLVVLPTYLLLVKKDWSRACGYEAVVCCFAVVLLGVIAGGLAMNELLPLVGVRRPLDRLPVLVGTDIALVGLALWRPRRWRHEPAVRHRIIRTVRRLNELDRLLMLAGLVIVLLAVTGAIRLNNGAGATVTVVMLCLAGLLVIAMIKWRFRLRPATVVVVIYLLALALLLMTSLRGWGITGHDIQVEFYVFQLTHDNGLWDIAAFPDAYNACLSITILPAIVSEITGVPGAAVFKVLIQLAFALCPVIVYLIARRAGSVLIGMLAAVYFIAFPTFFTDMPYLVRQETAFLFLGTTLLVATNRRWAVQRRQVWAGVLSVGLVLSHYSTTYVFIGLLAAALLTRGLARGGRWLRLRRRAVATGARPAAALGAVNIALLIVMAAIWTGPITHTGGQVERTASQLADTLFGSGDAAKSSDVSYNLFSGLLSSDRPSPEQRLQEYADSVAAETARPRAEGDYYPLATLQQYPASYVSTPTLLPLTVAGRALDAVGVDVTAVNTIMRQSAAKLLQLFVALGVLLVLLGRARRLRASPEMLHLAIGAGLVVALQVLLPGLSVDYGVLRAFQQAMFVLGPFLAVGSVGMFGWLGPRRSVVAAGGVVIAFFLSLTGAIPQVLGGYPAQLHLSNSGQYFDLYYPHPEEEAAAVWLQAQVLAEGRGTIQTIVPDRFIYGLSPTIVATQSIFPIAIRRDAYVLLGAATTGKHQSTVAYGGDLLAYSYPIAFLDGAKNLVYSNGTAVVYR